MSTICLAAATRGGAGQVFSRPEVSENAVASLRDGHEFEMKLVFARAVAVFFGRLLGNVKRILAEKSPDAFHSRMLFLPEIPC